MKLKRWPLIRHVRYFILRRRIGKWALIWARAGVGLGYINPSDEAQLDRIWKGDY